MTIVLVFATNYVLGAAGAARTESIGSELEEYDEGQPIPAVDVEMVIFLSPSKGVIHPIVVPISGRVADVRNVSRTIDYIRHLETKGWSFNFRGQTLKYHEVLADVGIRPGSLVTIEVHAQDG